MGRTQAARMSSVWLSMLVASLVLFWVATFAFGGRLWYKGSSRLLMQGRVFDFLVYCALSCLAFVNQTLMALEDVVFRDLALTDFSSESGKLVFILGHQRSGTTNVHKAVSSLQGCTTGTLFDLLFPSLLLKYTLRPMAGLLNRIYLKISGYEIANHNYGLLEELEEHLLMMHQFGGEVIPGVLFPHLGKDRKYVEECLVTKPIHFQFIKRCLARILKYQGTAQSIYIGCPLGFSQDPMQLLQHFPGAKLVVCARKPVDAIPSFVDLLQALTRADFSKEFDTRMKVIYDVYSTKVYQSLACATETVREDRIFWLSFDDWKENAPKQLQRIWDFLGVDWETLGADFDKALERSERHTNRAESYKVIDADMIERDLGESFKKIQLACSRQKR